MYYYSNQGCITSFYLKFKTIEKKPLSTFYMYCGDPLLLFTVSAQCDLQHNSNTLGRAFF